MPPEPTFTFTTTVPDTALEKWFSAHFREHSFAATGIEGRGPVQAITATLPDGTLCGAVTYRVFWGALHIKNLMVDEGHRGKGLARALMERALDNGRNAKCPFAIVETLSFQATGFYKKLGFIEEFVREGFSAGVSFHYLRKPL
ncbi:MAG: GNAT family N-acetyltransferase [Alphaproteobacteria bacterium]|nr:GNAT family N-acetyltransferase [Alphaproteobacteria bacterium]